MTVATAPAQRYQHSVETQQRLADRLIRVGRGVERIIPPPLGQSVQCVGRKK